MLQSTVNLEDKNVLDAEQLHKSLVGMADKLELYTLTYINLYESPTSPSQFNGNLSYEELTNFIEKNCKDGTVLSNLQLIALLINRLRTTKPSFPHYTFLNDFLHVYEEIVNNMEKHKSIFFKGQIDKAIDYFKGKKDDLKNYTSEIIKAASLQSKQEMVLASSGEKQIVAVLKSLLQPTSGVQQTESQYTDQIKKLYELLKSQAIVINAEDTTQFDKVMQLLQGIKVGLEKSSSSPLAIENSSNSSLYFPFADFSEERFGISGFKVSFFENNGDEYKAWKTTNIVDYEKLKLSESVSAGLYTALIMLAPLLSEENSKADAEKILFTLILNWDKKWSEIKKKISNFGATNSTNFQESLKNYTDQFTNDFFSNRNCNARSENLFTTAEKRRQGLGSLLLYKLDSEKHLFPVYPQLSDFLLGKEDADACSQKLKL